MNEYFRCKLGRISRHSSCDVAFTQADNISPTTRSLCPDHTVGSAHTPKGGNGPAGGPGGGPGPLLQPTQPQTEGIQMVVLNKAGKSNAKNGSVITAEVEHWPANQNLQQNEENSIQENGGTKNAKVQVSHV